MKIENKEIMKNLFRNYLSISLFALILIVVACKKDDVMTPAKSSDKSMSSFAYSSLSPAVSSTITGTTVAAMVPFNVDVTSLAPTVTVAAKATVSPASGSTQNFTNAVTYTVTAEDGTTQAYSVTVTKGIAPKSTAKDITKFSFAALSPVVDATIDATTKAITATVPATTDITKLVPTITISDKATVSPASGVATDFSKEVSYTVTAEDLSTVVWKVNVKKEVVVLVKFLWDYDKIPEISKPNPTTLLVKGVTIKSAPKSSGNYKYWYGYWHPTKGKIYLGNITEANNFSYDFEVKDLLPNSTYKIRTFVYSLSCDASITDGKACEDKNFLIPVPENNNNTKNTYSAKTSDFPDNSDNSIASYKNIRLFVTLGSTPSPEDSCLLDVANGKVYPLRDGAKNSQSISVYYSMNDVGLSSIFYSPSVTYDPQLPVYKVIKSQSWSKYQATYIGFGQTTLAKTDPSYNYTWKGGWHNITNADGINKFKYYNEDSM